MTAMERKHRFYSQDQMGYFQESHKEMALSATRHANACYRLMADDSDDGLQAAKDYFQDQGFDLPEQLNDEQLKPRLQHVKWWRRQYVKQTERLVEQRNIQLGRVHKHSGLYVSDTLIHRVLQRQEYTKRFLEGMSLVSYDMETGEEIDNMKMLDLVKRSLANLSNRKAELIVRLRGLEKLAAEQGKTGIFYTVTCPSKYHAVTKGSLNSKYKGTTPRDAQDYLMLIWSRIRAQFKKRDLEPTGIRVCEPHHDGCPHWHLLLFIEPEKQALLTETIRHYAMLEDGDEKGADKHRFDAELIDPQKGDAVGYIIKYISKNIDGKRVDGKSVGEDGESNGLDSIDTAARVRVWASLWGIRQFQFIGTEPVGVWRELRKQKESFEDEALELMRLAADNADWFEYSKLQDELKIKVLSVEEDHITGEPFLNCYEEVIKNLIGLYSVITTQDFITKTKRWFVVIDKAQSAPCSSVNNYNFINPIKHSQNIHQSQPPNI